MSGTNVERRVGRQRLEVNDHAPWVAEFTRDLLSTGYTIQTARRYDAVARHLAHWLALAEVAVADIDETTIGRFARHRCRCFGQRRATHVSGKNLMDVRRVVELLGKRAIVRQLSTSTAPVPDRRVVEFQDWLRHHRGVSERTIELHGRMVMRLLPALGKRPRRWNAKLLREVIVAETGRVSRSTDDGRRIAQLLAVPRRTRSLPTRSRAGRADHSTMAAVDTAALH